MKVKTTVLAVAAFLLGLFQVAYPPKEGTVLQLVTRIVFWFVVAYLVLQAYIGLRAWWKRRHDKPVGAALHGTAHMTGALHMTATGHLTTAPAWIAGASTALGEAMPHRPDLQGLLMYLRNRYVPIPQGQFMCQARIGGVQADARVNRPAPSDEQMSVVYPAEFTTGTTVPLPLPPGQHVAAWREIHGATSTFLVGLNIEVTSEGKVSWEPTYSDPMKG